MLYTIGYGALTPARLKEITEAIDARVIDCRKNPVTRIKAGFGRTPLTELLGERYDWRGNELGGRGNITPAGIKRLGADSKSETLLLMCVEEAPGECHRHEGICHPHFPKAIHIYKDQLLTAKALQACFDDDTDEYDVVGELKDIL